MESVQTSVKVLVVEDKPEVRNLISLALKYQKYSADFAHDPVEASVQLRYMARRYAAMLVDLHLNGVAELIDEAARLQPGVPVIGLSNGSGVQGEKQYAAVEEIISEPITGTSLHKAIQRCLDRRAQPNRGSHLESSSSVWRTRMLPIIRQVAGGDIPVLIQGETGTGKEVLARQLHSLSPRAKKPFFKVNCAALPSELIESELFGYERGAFTGAVKNNPGKFETAEGGTILLDEIGDMDFKLQAKLLQVLQDSEFTRLGSSETRRVDVRVMAATHCNLEQAIADGRFREDLYYRLNVITIEMAPLRERQDEILPLAHHFLRKYSNNLEPDVEITPNLRQALLSHDWPGNIRELENVIRRLLVLREPELVADDINTRARRHTSAPAMRPISLKSPAEDSWAPEPARKTAQPNAAAAAAGAGLFTHSAAPPPAQVEPVRPISMPDRWTVLERVDQARRKAETDAILAALNSTLWNRKRAAELLNIDYKALLYKMKKLGVTEHAKIAI